MVAGVRRAQKKAAAAVSVYLNHSETGSTFVSATFSQTIDVQRMCITVAAQATAPVIYIINRSAAHWACRLPLRFRNHACRKADQKSTSVHIGVFHLPESIDGVRCGLRRVAVARKFILPNGGLHTGTSQPGSGGNDTIRAGVRVRPVEWAAIQARRASE